MAFTDADTSTADVIDPIDVSAILTADPRTVAWSPTGDTLYVAGSGSSDKIAAITAATGVVSLYHTLATSARIWGLRADATGKVWWGNASGLYSFDGTTETAVPNFTAGARAFALIDATTAYVIDDNRQFQTLNLTDGSTPQQRTLASGSYLHHELSVFAVP